MTNEEIIRYDMARNWDGSVTPEMMLEDLSNTLQSGEEQLLRQGNTLFVFNKDQDGNLEFHTFNAEPAAKLIEHAMKFFEFGKLMGFDKAVTYYTNPKIDALFKEVEKTYPVELISLPQEGKTKAEVGLT